MKNITYLCDLCEQPIEEPDALQCVVLVPVDFGRSSDKALAATGEASVGDKHVCPNCTDTICRAAKGDYGTRR